MDGAEAAVEALADFIKEYIACPRNSVSCAPRWKSPQSCWEGSGHQQSDPQRPRQLSWDEIYDLLLECL